MDKINLFLFIGIAVPLAMMLAVFSGKSRRSLFFLIIGLFVSLFTAELNALLISSTAYMPRKFYSVNVSPLVEETLKATPIFLYAFFLKPRKQVLLECSVALGVGFAILENTFVLVMESEQYNLLSALVRGFGAGIMHGFCSLLVGYGISFIKASKKLFCTGTVALLALASIYHSIYNALVQSAYEMAGFMLPGFTFILFFVFAMKRKPKEKPRE